MSFSQRTVEIPRGWSVRWTNVQVVAHTVTEGTPDDTTGAPLFDSGYLGLGQSFVWTFPQVGEWRYWCRTHRAAMRDYIVRVK